jgi:uncharacterized protein (DUF983 family)
MAGLGTAPVPPLSAGLRCRCPRCGRGRLYDGLLAVTERCATCNLDLAPHDSGDGPAVFVILILGAVVMPFVFAFERLVEPPMWAHMIVWPPVVIVLAITLLRLMKATLVALHYKNLGHEYDGAD